MWKLINRSRGVSRVLSALWRAVKSLVRQYRGRR